MSAATVDTRPFSRSWRGDDPSEVDEYVERLTQYAVGLEDRAVTAESALDETRQRLAAALGNELSGRLAQILTLAQEEADDIRDRARVEAQSITEDATRVAEELRRGAAEQLFELEHQIDQLRTTRDGFVGELRNLGSEIVQTTDRYDPGIVSPENLSPGLTHNEHVPVFDDLEETQPVGEPTQPVPSGHPLPRGHD